MKHKNGRRTSHSYWSWTHGPRETTHNSSGRRPWWWRSSRWWSSPPAGCREEFSWCSRSWKRRRRRNRDEIAKKSSRLEGFGRRFKYMPKGGISGASGGPGAPPARPRGGAPPVRLEPWWPPRLYFGRKVASGTLIFYIIFLDFSWQFS